MTGEPKDWRQRRAYQLGSLAHTVGKPIDANPYTHETSIQSRNHRAWRMGWSNAAGSAAAQRVIDSALGRSE